MRELFESLIGRSIAVWHEGGPQATGIVRDVGSKFVVLGEWSGDAAMHLVIPFERIFCVRYTPVETAEPAETDAVPTRPKKHKR